MMPLKIRLQALIARIVLTANAMLDSMFSDPNFEQLKGKHLIEVSDVINDTTQPNLDMNLLTTEISAAVAVAI